MLQGLGFLWVTVRRFRVEALGLWVRVEGFKVLGFAV